MFLLALTLLACDFGEEPETIETERVTVRDYTAEEMEVLCKELTTDARTQLLSRQARVENLEAVLKEKEAELEALKKQDEVDETKRQAAAKRWKEIESEIASLKVERDAAVAERDALRVELKDTLKELDRQIVRAETFKAKAKEFKKKSTENDWQAFLANAKLEICDKGTRKRHEKCHEAVDLALGASVVNQFEVCVDGYQARPELRSLERGEELPANAQRLPDDNKFTKKGWAIVFCDPSLPEGQTLDDLDRELMEKEIDEAPAAGEVPAAGEAPAAGEETRELPRRDPRTGEVLRGE